MSLKNQKRESLITNSEPLITDNLVWSSGYGDWKSTLEYEIFVSDIGQNDLSV